MTNDFFEAAKQNLAEHQDELQLLQGILESNIAIVEQLILVVEELRLLNAPSVIEISDINIE
jgi:hypothetical protein